MPAQPPPLPPVTEQSFDLARLAQGDDDKLDFHVRPKDCAPGSSGEIVVCVKRRERNRLEAPTGNYATKEGLPKAKVDFGGGKSLGVITESSPMGGGATSTRVMVTGKIKF